MIGKPFDVGSRHAGRAPPCIDNQLDVGPEPPLGWNLIHARLHLGWRQFPREPDDDHVAFRDECDFVRHPRGPATKFAGDT